MEKIFSFFINFIIIYSFYYLFIIMRNKKIDKITESIEVKFLKLKYNFQPEKHNLKKLASIIALCNSLIISVVIFIVSFVNVLIFKIIIGFITLLILQLLVYHIIGMYYQNRKEV